MLERFKRDIYQIVADDIFKIPKDSNARLNHAFGMMNVVQTDGHTGCNHNWKQYVGFTESYRYCTKCTEKRNLNDE